MRNSKVYRIGNYNDKNNNTLSKVILLYLLEPLFCRTGLIIIEYINNNIKESTESVNKIFRGFVHHSIQKRYRTNQRHESTFKMKGKKKFLPTGLIFTGRYPPKCQPRPRLLNCIDWKRVRDINLVLPLSIPQLQCK
jgi:hypothetical protein